MSSVIVVLSPGCEEIELVTPIDLLRRAGITVTLASIDLGDVKGAHDISFKADTQIENCDGNYSGIIIPGGMPGTVNALKSTQLREKIKSLFSLGSLVAAICAAPRVLDSAGVLESHCFTCYPGVESEISIGNHRTDPVVRDRTIITANGVGSAIPFSLEIIRYLTNLTTAQDIAEKVLFPWNPISI